MFDLSHSPKRIRCGSIWKIYCSILIFLLGLEDAHTSTPHEAWCHQAEPLSRLCSFGIRKRPKEPTTEHRSAPLLRSFMELKAKLKEIGRDMNPESEIRPKPVPSKFRDSDEDANSILEGLIDHGYVMSAISSRHPGYSSSILNRVRFLGVRDR